MSFGGHLKHIRKSKKVTQEQLANLIGKHVTQIKRYENDGSEPTVSVLIDISKALQISIEELVFSDNSPISEINTKLKDNFKKVINLPDSKKSTILELLEAFTSQKDK